jgi:hypothetical protein
VKLVAVAETAKGFGSRLGLAHTERLELVDAHVDMDPHLVGQFARDALPAPRQLEKSTDR